MPKSIAARLRDNIIIDVYFIAALLLPLPIILAAGFADGEITASADIVLHLNRIISNTNSLYEGLFWPRWYPDMFMGYGYPLPNYYPPGVSMIGALFVLIGLTPVTALILTQILALMTGSAGAYLFARLYSGNPAALLASAAYLYVPFVFFHLYNIGNVPQLFAFNVIPWCFWGIARAARTPRAGFTAIIAVTIAIALLMHQLAGLMGVVAASAYALVASWAASEGSVWGDWRRYAMTLSGIGLGFLLAAISWLPALADADAIYPLTQTTSRLGATVADNFILPGDLLNPPVTVDQTAQVRLFRLSMGIPQIVLIVLSVVLIPFITRKATRWRATHIITGAIGIAILLYLMTYRSSWVWEAIPSMDIILQPWRFFGVVYVLMIPLAALTLDWVIARTHPRIVPLLLIVLFAPVLPVYFPAVDPVAYSNDLRTPADTIDYEVRTGNYGSVVFGEYRPINLQSTESLTPCAACYADWQWRVYPQEDQLPRDVIVTGEDGTSPRSTTFTIDAPIAFPFVIHQFYFPGWRATLNGEPLTLFASTDAGLLTANIPSGEHELVVWYAGTPMTSAGFTISLWSLAVVLALSFRGWRHRASTQSAEQHHIGVAGVSIAVIIIGSLSLAFIIEPHTNWFRAVSSPDEPRYMQQVQQTVFTDETGDPQLVLLGYDLNMADNVNYGDWLYVDLYWRALHPQTTNWRVRVELADTVQGLPLLVNDNPTPGNIPVTAWDTDLYIVDRHILKINADVLPYLGRLEVGVWSDDGRQLITAGGGMEALLQDIRVDENGNCPIVDGITPEIRFDRLLTIERLQLDRISEQSLALDLCWTVHQSTDTNYRLFIHFYDGDTFLDPADQPPITRYPTMAWQSGQTLHNRYELYPPAEADSLRIGLYDAETGTRLPVTQGAAQDNSLIVPLNLSE